MSAIQIQLLVAITMIVSCIIKSDFIIHKFIYKTNNILKDINFLKLSLLFIVCPMLIGCFVSYFLDRIDAFEIGVFVFIHILNYALYLFYLNKKHQIKIETFFIPYI
jgi:hypothetical protein